MENTKVIRNVIGVLMLIAIAYFVYQVFAEPISNVTTDIIKEFAAPGEEFLVALKEEDFEKAFSLCSSDFQELLGSVDYLAEMFKDVEIDTWESEAQAIKTESGKEGIGLFGVLTLAGGIQLDFEIILLKEGDNYMVAGFKSAPK